MTNTRTDTALQVALAYHQAWAGGDFGHAITYISPDITCHTPAGTITGADAFRDFMGPFAAMTTRVELIGAFGESDQALVMYDTGTPDVASAPGAEWHTVRDGKVIEMRIVFDRLPFALAVGEVAPAGSAG
ncbi:hypothetical protein GCM10023169_24720 [Georgenia halophila]|uniref:SnoaL-like domain-containing protein n=1 Tax=Georgenia halophila TaxID=620889 RepID=A0ABP8LC55_9MICO